MNYLQHYERLSILGKTYNIDWDKIARLTDCRISQLENFIRGKSDVMSGLTYNVLGTLSPPLHAHFWLLSFMKKDNTKIFKLSSSIERINQLNIKKTVKHWQIFIYLLERFDISQRRISLISGTTPNQVNFFCNGKKDVTTATLESFLNALPPEAINIWQYLTYYYEADQELNDYQPEIETQLAYVKLY